MKICEPDPQRVYPIEMVVRMTGAAERKIVFYCRQGMIRPARDPEREGWQFDEDSVMRLRKIESLRRHHRMNWAAIRTIMDLLQEVEELRRELRFRR